MRKISVLNLISIKSSLSMEEIKRRSAELELFRPVSKNDSFKEAYLIFVDKLIYRDITLFKIRGYNQGPVTSEFTKVCPLYEFLTQTDISEESVNVFRVIQKQDSMMLQKRKGLKYFSDKMINKEEFYVTDAETLVKILDMADEDRNKLLSPLRYSAITAIEGKLENMTQQFGTEVYQIRKTIEISNII